MDELINTGDTPQTGITLRNVTVLQVVETDDRVAEICDVCAFLVVGKCLKCNDMIRVASFLCMKNKIMFGSRPLLLRNMKTKLQSQVITYMVEIDRAVAHIERNTRVTKKQLTNMDTTHM